MKKQTLRLIASLIVGGLGTSAQAVIPPPLSLAPLLSPNSQGIFPSSLDATTTSSSVYGGGFGVGAQQFNYTRGIPLFDTTALLASPIGSASLSLPLQANFLDATHGGTIELRLFSTTKLQLDNSTANSFAALTGTGGGPYTTLGTIPVNSSTSGTVTFTFNAADVSALNTLLAAAPPRIGIGLMEFGTISGTLEEIVFNSSNTRLNVTFVPEPSIFGLLGLGMASLIAFRRRN